MSIGPFEIGKNNGRGFQLRPSTSAPILEFKNSSVHRIFRFIKCIGAHITASYINSNLVVSRTRFWIFN